MDRRSPEKGKKPLKIHNKSDKPDNIIRKESEIIRQCEELEKSLPAFLRSFFSYLRGNVLPMTRLAYLRDIHFFFRYLIHSGFAAGYLGKAAADAMAGPEDIPQLLIRQLKGSDINAYLDWCRRYAVETEEEVVIYENESRSLARKKSSLSVMFKYLYREEIIEKNIADKFDPIRVPKAGEREIKALQDSETRLMLYGVTYGADPEGREIFTPKEKAYWRRTRLRDKAVLLLFLTYGLRLSELQQLNVSSFRFSRNEFLIYRKRGKESVMPLNRSVSRAVEDYIRQERLSGDLVDPLHRDALFLSVQGRRMTERQLRELVKKYTSIAMGTSREAGYSPHKLRATAATSLIGRGSSIFDVQALLDHEQVTTTQLYAAHKKNVRETLVRGMEWEEEIAPPASQDRDRIFGEAAEPEGERASDPEPGPGEHAPASGAQAGRKQDKSNKPNNRKE